jgi:hypothetical protein
MKAEETLKLDIDDTIKECESAEAKSLVGGDIQTILSQLISTIKVCLYVSFHTVFNTTF